jgi:hypothetical protein
MILTAPQYTAVVAQALVQPFLLSAEVVPHVELHVACFALQLSKHSLTNGENSPSGKVPMDS